MVDRVSDLSGWRYRKEASRTLVDGSHLTGGAWNFDAIGSLDFFDRMPDLVTNLGKVARIFQGLVTGADKVFIVANLRLDPGASPGPDGTIKVRDRSGTEWLLEEQLLKPFLNHVTVSTFEALAPAHRLIFPYHIAGDRATLVSASEMKRLYPRTWEYLLHNKEALQDDPHSLHYLQVLLNSPLIDALLHQISSLFRGGYWSYGKRFIERLPIRLIDFLNRDEMRKHDEIVDLVKRLIFLNTSLSSEPPGHGKTLSRRQIQTTTDQVNAIVYYLYGLSRQEQQLVEHWAGGAERVNPPVVGSL